MRAVYSSDLVAALHCFHLSAMCNVGSFCTYMRVLIRHVLRCREGFLKPPQQCDARYILHMQVSLTAPLPAHFGVLYTASPAAAARTRQCC